MTPSHHIVTTDTVDVCVTTPGVHVFSVTNISATITLRIMHRAAHVYLFGIFDARGRDVYTLSTLQHHSVPGATSHVLIKGVFRAHAGLRYSGTIRIDADAPASTATLTNHNLVLGTNTSVTTTPQLEVIPSDVQCAHAATVGPPDADAIHALMQRGLTRAHAQRLLVHGFLDEVHRRRDALLTHNTRP